MAIPRLSSFDSTRAFLREGYAFVGNRCRETGSDAFRTRIMLRPVTCISGAEAAERFYDGRHFTREGAMPPTTLHLLQDEGSVQQLDDGHHRLRKAMFLGLLTGAKVEEVVALFERNWRRAEPRWRSLPAINLHETMQLLLCETACEWVGVPVSGRELIRRTEEMAAMIGSAGRIGPGVVRALLLRRRAELWARDAIVAARAETPDETPVSVIAHHREPDGSRLDPEVAAVELLNLVRPTVAIARFIAFAALALHEHREAAEWLGEDEAARLGPFTDEVRRFYPFFPVIGGRVREEFEWLGHGFEEGDWVLLGLHSTDHDPALWDEPEAFRPQRFADRTPSPFDLVPQGAGDHAKDHRCPGEWFTIALVGRALALLREARPVVPEQDLTVPLDRFPTLPGDGLMLSFA